jgi:competence CoiA-like predicted nuclease
MGKLQTAKDNRKYQEYQASVTEAQRIEQMNQSRLNYQRQLAEYEQRLADREFGRVDGRYYPPHLSVKSGRARFRASSFRLRLFAHVDVVVARLMYG